MLERVAEMDLSALPTWFLTPLPVLGLGMILIGFLAIATDRRPGLGAIVLGLGMAISASHLTCCFGCWK